MKPEAKTSFLHESIRLLIRHFGVNEVRATLAEISKRHVEPSIENSSRIPNKLERRASPTVNSLFEHLKETDQEKHAVIMAFYVNLKAGNLLPESQDIRQFAQIIGLKEINGKSRKDLLPGLMRFLFDQPTEKLRVDLKRAETVSEQQRQQGFSVLTDKLMGNE